MSPKLKECSVRALKLPPRERAALAERLISSLDTLDNAENERLWLEEADRRYEQFKSRKIPARSAEQVLRDARSAVK